MSGARRGARPLSRWSVRVRALVLGAILATSAVLQLLRINDWQTFSDDQAMQMNVLHGMLVDHHLPLLGMALSVGSAHIGPLFYYLLALPLWLGQALVGYLDPTAGVIMIGLFQVATVYLLYRLCLLVGAPWAGLCCAGLYATSGLVVYWSRFLWPNIAPFFVVLALYALLALAQGRPRFLPLLAGSLAAAAQMQPTAVLLIPVAAIWLLAVRPRVTPRLALLSSGIVVLLFAPVIAYDLTHHLAEARAWLAYATTVRPGAAAHNGLAGGLHELAQLGWQAVGLRTRSRVELLLAVAALAVVACALGLAGRPRALLARLLVLWSLLYLLAFALYRGALHPHYVEPLYPLPFLAIGLLLDLVATASLPVLAALGSWLRAARPRRWALAGVTLRAASVALVVGLAVTNVRHLWADQFGLDAFQLDSPAQVPGSQVTLGEMRGAASLIARSAAREPYSFLLAVRDGDGGGFAYLQRQASAPPAISLDPLQFLLVEPADRPPWLWPAATRRRWSESRGGFVWLPHLLLWRLRMEGQRQEPRVGLWQSTAATAGEVTAITLPPGAGRVVAGFVGGAATLSARGQAWRAAVWPDGPNGQAEITAFAWSAACPRRLYAATYAGLLVSADSGATWRPPPAQPPGREILALWADAQHCGVVLAGGEGGVVRTQDGAAHWRTVSREGRRGPAVQALAGNPDSGVVYAGSSDGVWMSTDGGRTWPSRAQRDDPRSVLSLLPPAAGAAPRLLAGSQDGLAVSSDDGATWRPIGRGLQAVVYALLAVDGQGILLAGTDAGLYLSRNDGADWQPTALPPGIAVKALAQGPGREVYAASSLGVYRSTDGGTTWQHL